MFEESLEHPFLSPEKSETDGVSRHVNGTGTTRNIIL